MRIFNVFIDANLDDGKYYNPFLVGRDRPGNWILRPTGGEVGWSEAQDWARMEWNNVNFTELHLSEYGPMLIGTDAENDGTKNYLTGAAGIFSSGKVSGYRWNVTLSYSTLTKCSARIFFDATWRDRDDFNWDNQVLQRSNKTGNFTLRHVTFTNNSLHQRTVATISDAEEGSNGALGDMNLVSGIRGGSLTTYNDANGASCQGFNGSLGWPVWLVLEDVSCFKLSAVGSGYRASFLSGPVRVGWKDDSSDVHQKGGTIIVKNLRMDEESVHLNMTNPMIDDSRGFTWLWGVMAHLPGYPNVSGTQIRGRERKYICREVSMELWWEDVDFTAVEPSPGPVDPDVDFMEKGLRHLGPGDDEGDDDSWFSFP
jgi:hypothetical protein